MTGSVSPSAMASWVTTDSTGSDAPKANVRAATIPTRSPVNGPGPIPATTPVRSVTRIEASTRQSWMKSPMTSACLRVSAESRSARTTPWESTIATLVPADVSIARYIEPPHVCPLCAISCHRDGERLYRFFGKIIRCRLLAARVCRTSLRLVTDSITGSGGSRDINVQPRFADAVEQPSTPFDDDDGCVEVDVEIVELYSAAQPIGIDVHKRRGIRCRIIESRMRACEHESGARHSSTDAEGFTDRA